MSEQNIIRNQGEKNIIERLKRIEELLQAKTETPINFEQACIYLDLSASQLYKLVSNQQITHYKPGGKKIYFRKCDLDAWLLRNPIKSKSEIEDAAMNYMLKIPKKA